MWKTFGLKRYKSVLESTLIYSGMRKLRDATNTKFKYQIFFQILKPVIFKRFTFEN